MKRDIDPEDHYPNREAIRSDVIEYITIRRRLSLEDFDMDGIVEYISKLANEFSDVDDDNIEWIVRTYDLSRL